MTTEIKLSKKDMEKILKEKFPNVKKIEWDARSEWKGDQRDQYEVKVFNGCKLTMEEK